MTNLKGICGRRLNVQIAFPIDPRRRCKNSSPSSEPCPRTVECPNDDCGGQKVCNGVSAGRHSSTCPEQEQKYPSQHSAELPRHAHVRGDSQGRIIAAAAVLLKFLPKGKVYPKVIPIKKIPSKKSSKIFQKQGSWLTSWHARAKGKNNRR
jgi:hypothetical protein